jgi:hypothetical protein
VAIDGLVAIPVTLKFAPHPYGAQMNSHAPSIAVEPVVRDDSRWLGRTGRRIGAVGVVVRWKDLSSARRPISLSTGVTCSKTSIDQSSSSFAPLGGHDPVDSFLRRLVVPVSV